MITEKHYSNKNEHPEDKIYDVKKFIMELENVQNFYFNQLMLELNLKDDPKIHDYLFDYIFNQNYGPSFQEYLEKFEEKYENFVNENV